MGSFPKYDVQYLIVPLCYIIVPLLVISLLYSSWGSIELGGKAMWQLFQLLSMPIIYLKNIVCTCKYKAKVQFSFNWICWYYYTVIHQVTLSTLLVVLELQDKNYWTQQIIVHTYQLDYMTCWIRRGVG